MTEMSKQKTIDSEFSNEKVRCEICGREFEQITPAHLKTHGITMHEYREHFPDASLVSEGFRKKISEVTSGKEPWNKGLTKETDDRIKKISEKQSKTKKEFFASEKGQKWLDEHIRDENSPLFDTHPSDETRQKMSDNSGMKGKHPYLTEETKQNMRDNSPHLSGEKSNMFGKTGDKHPTWKGGPEEARARSEEKHRGFGFIPLNKNFVGAEGHHLDTHFVLYIPEELHRSVYHNMFTGQGMKEINDLAIRSVYGDHDESRW